MKKISIYLLGVLMILSSCKETPKQVQKTPEVNITTIVNPAEGLDLKLVGVLLQKGTIKTASDLEQALNEEGGINNLDLNSDGKVDFINVSENPSKGNQNVKSFDLTTGKDSETTYIATIEVEKGKETYNINLAGSETLYGNNAHYQSSHSLSSTDMLLMYWMFSANRPLYYHSPYHYGSYPSYYSQPRVVSNTVYNTRTVTQRKVANSTVKKSVTPYKTKVSSTNKGKISTKARTSINNHNTSQKSFQTRDVNKTVNKTGFTNTKPTTTTKNTFPLAKPQPKSSSYKSKPSISFRSSASRRSDGNFKTNITQIENALSLITELDGVTYLWDEKVLNTDEKFESVVGTPIDSSTQVGFIAQDVEKVIPYLVSEDEYGKRVNYDLLVVYLVEAIKQQQKEIEKLKNNN